MVLLPKNDRTGPDQDYQDSDKQLHAEKQNRFTYKYLHNLLKLKINKLRCSGIESRS